MSKSWKEIADEAKQKTSKELSSDIIKLTNLSREELDKIAPAKLDKEHLTELIMMVKDATKSNEEKAQAIKNTDHFLSLAVSIIGKLL